MRKFCPIAAAVIVVGVLQPAWAASAISVVNATTNTTIFSDDGFEDDTLGLAPTGGPPPTIGSYTIVPGSDPTNYATTNAASPGPYDGDQYLYMHREIGGAENTARLDAVFSATPTLGDTIKASFAFLYESTTASSVAIRLMSASGNGSNANTRAVFLSESDYGETNWYSIAGINGARTNTSLSLTPGTWQTIGIEYTTGSTDIKFTVNGVTETLVGATNAGNFNRIRFSTAAANSTFYLDAVPGGPSGDYNGDGFYDAADYVIWRKTDGNNQAGYNAWRSKFGTGTSAGASLSSAAIPEPGAPAMLAVLVCTGCAFSRRDGLRKKIN